MAPEGAKEVLMWVQREDLSSSVILIRGDKGNKAGGTFVETVPAAEHDPAGNIPALLFTRHENQYRLSGVWESGTEGQTLVS